MAGNRIRILATVAIVSTWLALNLTANSVSSVAVGHLGALQFQDSDAAYATMQAGTQFLKSPTSLISIVDIVVLIMLWASVARKFVNNSKETLR